MYARHAHEIVRASDLARGAPDDFSDHGLIVRLMKLDPSLSYDGARGLLTQYRDHIAAPSVN